MKDPVIEAMIREEERKYPPHVVAALDKEEKRKPPKQMKRKKDHPARKHEEFVDEKTTPKHYTELSITPVDIIESWDLDFFTGTALKYIARRGNKPGETEVDDLNKAIWYLQRRVRNLESSEE